MEFLIVILLIVILALVANAKGSIIEHLNRLENEVVELKASLGNASKLTETIQPPKTVVQPKPKAAEEYWETSFKLEDTSPVTHQPYIKPKQSEEWLEEVKRETVVPEAAFEQVINEPSTTPPPVSKPGFFERNPDLEKFIGENLVSKIGIAILVLAIGYFVKYAIDNNWIGTIGRVAIGLICGGILVGLAHRLQKNYQSFSSVLIGGGLATFYFTIVLAYHEYHLFGSVTTFIIMLVITAFAVALALLYNRQEVAIIALVGGFATPFMASSGSGNYQSLFIYLIVLNAGLLVLAYYKSWRLLNLLAFIFTTVLFATWLFRLEEQTSAATYRNAFIYASIFYVMFFIINLANNIRENKKFIASDFGIILANTCLYFSVGLYCIAKMNGTVYNGLFSASLAIFNMAASWLIFRNGKTDKNILYLLIGLTLTFVSLTAPLQLHGNHITLFWASECVLLYWLFQRSEIKLFQTSSIIIYAAMLTSLVLDWSKVYQPGNAGLPIIFNRGFITSVYSGLASFALFLLMQKQEAPVTSSISANAEQKAFRTIALLLWYLAGLLEIIYQFKYHYPQSGIFYSYVQIYTFSYVLILLLVAKRSKAFELSWANKSLLLSACLVLYISLTGNSYRLQEVALVTQILNDQFIISQVVIIILTGIVFFKTARLLQYNFNTANLNATVYTWLICAAIIIYLSVEVHLFVNQVFYSADTPLNELKRIYIKTGLPILWGLSSFAFMWAGMHYKFRSLRIISLSLFTLTLAKLFMFDIRNIPVAGKIAAFFCLGVLLLVISFMYQRLKKIIIEDEKTAAT